MSLTITEHVLTETKLRLSPQHEFKLERFARATATVDTLVKSMKFNGGVVVEGFLTPAEVMEAEMAAKPVLDSMTYSNPTDTTKRISRLPTRLPDLVERVLTDELYMGVADTLLSVTHQSWLGTKLVESVAKPVACATTMFAVAPGTPAQDLHRDDSIYYNFMPRIQPEEYKIGRDVCISFFIAGRKTTKENGATVFSPGSHLDAYNDPPILESCISAELEAGDAFIMLSSCYHGAGCNSTTDQERLVYSLFMMQPHLRQEENMYLTTSTEQVKSYSLPVQRRLGYDVANPNLGWIDHSSPLESFLGHVGVDTRFIPGYNPSKEKDVEVAVAVEGL